MNNTEKTFETTNLYYDIYQGSTGELVETDVHIGSLREKRRNLATEIAKETGDNVATYDLQAVYMGPDFRDDENPPVAIYNADNDKIRLTLGEDIDGAIRYHIQYDLEFEFSADTFTARWNDHRGAGLSRLGIEISEIDETYAC